MRIGNFLHKGLKRLYTEDNGKGVPADTVDKLHKMLAFIDEMQGESELSALPSWKAHTLVGNRKGSWSLSVTRNQRLTFCVDQNERETDDIDLEDYFLRSMFMPLKQPPHPGDFIRTEILAPTGLSVTAAATVLQISRPTPSSLLNATSDLSGEMALRIEKAFGVKMDTLMSMRMAHNIAKTRKREGEIHIRRFAA